jgi:hypothetical protein
MEYDFKGTLDGFSHLCKSMRPPLSYYLAKFLRKGYDFALGRMARNDEPFSFREVVNRNCRTTLSNNHSLENCVGPHCAHTT